MTPKKPDWFELTDGENSPANVRKINKKLPFAALVATGAIIVGGSLFANANDESSAVAETPTSSQSTVAGNPTASQSAIANTSPNISSSPSKSASGVNSLPVPSVSNVPQRGDGDHEGRERGEHHEGEHHDGDRFEHDDD